MKKKKKKKPRLILSGLRHLYPPDPILEWWDKVREVLMLAKGEEIARMYHAEEEEETQVPCILSKKE